MQRKIFIGPTYHAGCCREGEWSRLGTRKFGEAWIGCSREYVTRWMWLHSFSSVYLFSCSCLKSGILFLVVCCCFCWTVVRNTYLIHYSIRLDFGEKRRLTNIRRRIPHSLFLIHKNASDIGHHESSELGSDWPCFGNMSCRSRKCAAGWSFGWTRWIIGEAEKHDNLSFVFEGEISSNQYKWNGNWSNCRDIHKS